ncbi:MAG TPA: helix-turn-helix transcriptional regulator [Steroidobacteraceae bacterium]|jgi:DNA-binding CsgD family transcriptional regulator|nr:helix-turn-helix transcriptional regulator [Steroidobacteraceae bacterium]
MPASAQTEAKSKAAGRKSAVPAAWAAASAEILDHFDDPILPDLLARALSTLIEFEYSVVFIYRGKANPIHVHDTFPGAPARAGLINYVKNTYVLNPLYNAYQRGLKTGVYRLRDLASEGLVDRESLRKYRICPTSSEEIGYLTDGWPAGREELCIAMELPNGECAELTLSRKASQGGFADEDVESLSPVIPFLASAVRRYWRHARLMHLSTTPDTGADDALRAFGRNLLSPRERELAQLLLRGHSSASIGLRLGISTTTVKTHRKNLYSKLGIATQSEFFSLFLDSISNGSHI